MSTNTNKTQKNSTVFVDAHYESNNGMLTTVWGNLCWNFLHLISFNYPIKPTMKEKHNYRNYILSLKNILPCGICRDNLKKNFKKLPLTMADMKNRTSFSTYIYNLHELVNEMLHKKSNLSYDQVKERYEHFRSRCKSKDELLKQNKTMKKKKENGCTEPLIVGRKKVKCVLTIVDKDKKCESFIFNNTK